MSDAKEKEEPVYQNVRLIWPKGAGVSASQLGVALARDCDRKECRIVDALVIVRYEDGDLQSAWSNMDNSKAAELSLYGQGELQRQIWKDNGQMTEFEE